MNGVHDMGGAQGFGPVRPEPDEPLFHAPWERQAMALTVAMGATGQWNIDQMRSARESLPPAQYLGLSYYQIWVQALSEMMLARGLVSAHELRTGQMSQPATPGVRALARSAVDAESFLGLVAAKKVFDGAAHHVVDAGHTVGRGRTLIKHKRRRAVAK